MAHATTTVAMRVPASSLRSSCCITARPWACSRGQYAARPRRSTETLLNAHGRCPTPQHRHRRCSAPCGQAPAPAACHTKRAQAPPSAPTATVPEHGRRKPAAHVLRSTSFSRWPKAGEQAARTAGKAALAVSPAHAARTSPPQRQPTPHLQPRQASRLPAWRKSHERAHTVPRHSAHETGDASMPAPRSILPSGPLASAFADSASRLPNSYNAHETSGHRFPRPCASTVRTRRRTPAPPPPKARRRPAHRNSSHSHRLPTTRKTKRGRTLRPLRACADALGLDAARAPLAPTTAAVRIDAARRRIGTARHGG